MCQSFIGHASPGASESRNFVASSEGFASTSLVLMAWPNMQ